MFAASGGQQGELMDVMTLLGLHAGIAGESEATGSEKRVLEMFESFHEPLARYLFWLHVRSDRIDDLVQETFFRLHEHLRNHRLSEENLRGWIWKVTHNLALKELRENRRENSFISLEIDADHHSVTELTDPNPNPEERASLGQRQRRILKELNELGERERECLHLRAEGLSYREIGEVMGMGRSTVADSLRRAIDRLHSVINE